jgi:hypothetical protein
LAARPLPDGLFLFSIILAPQPYGVPYAIWGMAYILLFSFLLPGHDGAGHTDLTSELIVSDK